MKRCQWKSSYYQAKSRCININNPKYPRYSGRGIKFLMTMENFEFLWFIDNAYLMKCPSIDRKDNDGNYILENCEFIEMAKNAQKSSKNRIIKQILKDGSFKEFNSIREASLSLGVTSPKSGGLVNHLKGRKKTYHGFKWEYAPKGNSMKGNL